MAETKRVRVRYKPNNSDMGKLLMGYQTQQLADKAAKEGALVAKGIASSLGLPATYIAGIQARLGPTVVLDRNPRRTARVVATDSLSAALEFGSGRRRKRRQKGNSPAYRVLARAGSQIGQRKSFPGEKRQVTKSRGSS